MRKYAVSAGDKFNRLTALEPAERSKGYERRWQCRCDCGKTAIVTESSLHLGSTKSCGCWRREMQDALRDSRRGAGWTQGGGRTPTYRSWLSMKTRCLNSATPSYRLYGARGIAICARWVDSFETFLADMGERPAGTTLDRWPNNQGNYEPGNCRWATPTEQARNTRRVKLTPAVQEEITRRLAAGEHQHVVGADLGVSQGAITNFIRKKTWREAGEQPLPRVRKGPKA